MRRLLPAFALGPLALGLCLCVTRPAAAKSYQAEMYNSEIRVLGDGSLLVTEDVRFRFEEGPFHYVYRRLPLRKTDGIDEITSTEPITIRRRSSEVDVRWTFPELHDAVRTFRLAYRAHGVVYVKDGRPILRWAAFPTERDYAIGSARVRLRLPPGCPAPQRVATEPRSATIEEPDSGFFIDAGRIRANRTFVIEATFPAGAISATEPAWKAFEEHWKHEVPGFLAGGVAILLIGLGTMLRVRRASIAPAPSLEAASRDLPSVASPPSDLPPAIAGALRDGRISLAHAIATLLDLAARGQVRFETEGKRSRFQREKRFLRRVGSPESRAAWERIVLDGAFRDADPNGAVPLEKAWKGIYAASGSFREALKVDLEARGDFDPAMRIGVRRLYNLAIIAASLVVLSIVGTIVAFHQFGLAPLILTLALGAVAIAAMTAGGTLPLYSAVGREQSLGWRGFARYVKSAAKEKTPVNPERFNAWLAYAAAFGIADAWLRAGSRWGVQVPDWFRGAPGQPGSFDGWIPIFAGGGYGGAAGGAGGAAGGGGSGAG